ncbi:DMT family transporter [Stagnihabitans tardus]|uniref:EamA family transporter n=1 Tax=Stagnihabitans tardus TaxID=2699202 RepID=A0AAE4YCN8_9RHOB|nr:DMT family transporter [Stagnihabitans tardus]NBZ89604.1 EamA family transporter [Stagnihabitans tardus]
MALSRSLTGILLKVASVLVFIIMAALIKATSAHVPAGQAVFFRSLFAIPVIFAWLALTHELKGGIRTQNIPGHFFRGFLGTCAMGLGFAGLGYLPLPEVTAIGYAAPLLVVILAAMFLGEEVRLFRYAMVALGLTGVLIVLGPRLTVTEASGTKEAFGAMVVLMSATCAALAQVFVRKLTLTESTSAIVFWFSASSTLLSLITIPFGWVWPAPWEAALLVTCGILGGVGQLLLTASVRYGDASLIAPFEYSSMIFSLAIGWAFFDEIPTLTMLMGAGLVVLAGVLIIWREHRLGLRRDGAIPPQG